MRRTEKLGRLAIGLAFVVLLFLAGCSDPNDNNVSPNQVHPLDWVIAHALDPQSGGDADACRACHGVDYAGSNTIPGCFECHLDGPPFAAHPARWGDLAAEEHRHFSNIDLISWASCATAACHGVDLHGGSVGPSCFSDQIGAVSCHATQPFASVNHRTLFTDPNLHGPAAKGGVVIEESMNVCQNCHGRPGTTFDGGFVSDPAIVANPEGNCSACHPAARAHPTNWQGTNDDTSTNGYYSTHRTVSALTIERSCALCHLTTSTGSGPLPGAPSCFASGFTNGNGSATSCHPSGPGAAPHAVPFTDPNLHGPAAKADLTFCQQCHGELGGAGSNPRFNLAVGNLVNGCEDCHTVGTAHTTTDRWTFRGDAATTRRTHFASGNVLNACALCHGAALDGVGGSGPSCFSCHTGAPQFDLNCTFCHASPPAGAGDLTGATPVNHTAVTDPAGFNAAHDQCTTCHGAKDDGTGNLTTVGTDYQLFDRNTPALAQGGDHLDGNIEMNGPTPATGAGYNETTFGCDNACHAGDVPYRLSDSALTVEYGSYGNDPGPGCTFCHGYPPDGTADLTGSPTPVNHTGVTDLAGFLLAHNDCSTCHGVKDDGTGTHVPTGNYDVATDHADGNINLNLDTQYDQATFGCNAACHGNTAQFQLSDSGLPVVLDSYGSGGGAGACDACHTTGVAGAPVVIAGTTAHTGAWTCEDCHTSHGGGTLIIPNNAAVGINYPNDAEHQGGISLGGAVATGATEAQICWNCHDSIGSISEWGQNSKANTGNIIYNYGQIYTDSGTTTPTSNWVNAWWKSARSEFAYKTGQVRSTHSVNPAVTVAGVDAVGDIRCSYCHDVHDLNRAPGDAVTGAPYLRGSWHGNPYLEDGAPQLNTNYANNDRFGRVPRGANTDSTYGGYQIDQNNGNPTNGLTADGTSGLCELCHGGGNGSWTSAEINSLNQFGTASSAWVGSNGHANSVLGGGGTGSGLAANIFRTSDRQTSTVIFDRTGAGNPLMAYRNATGDRGYGFRSTDKTIDDAEGWNLNPKMADNSIGRPYGFNYYNWGATVNEGTTDNQYHKFTCSKCHNPHASRLPRLMISNCLDTKHNTWDDSAGIDTIPSTSSSVGTAVSTENRLVTFSNATSAQNCHRVKDPAFSNSMGSGWNLVTPWTTEAGGPDNGAIP